MPMSSTRSVDSIPPMSLGCYLAETVRRSAKPCSIPPTMTTLVSARAKQLITSTTALPTTRRAAEFSSNLSTPSRTLRFLLPTASSLRPLQPKSRDCLARNILDSIHLFRHRRSRSISTTTCCCPSAILCLCSSAVPIAPPSIPRYRQPQKSSDSPCSRMQIPWPGTTTVPTISVWPASASRPFPSTKAHTTPATLPIGEKSSTSTTTRTAIVSL